MVRGEEKTIVIDIVLALFELFLKGIGTLPEFIQFSQH